MDFLPNLTRMLVIYRNKRGHFIVSQLLVLVSAVFTLLIPTQTGRLINDGLLQADKAVVIDATLKMLLYAFLAGIFIVVNMVYAAGFAEGTVHFLRTSAYRKVQSFSFGNLDKFPTGELLIRLTSDIYQIKLAVNMVVRFFFQAPFQILVALVIVWIRSSNLVWILLVMIAAISVLMIFFTSRIQPLYRRRQAQLDAVNNVLQEDLAGMRVVKAFERQEYEKQRYDGVSRKYRDASFEPLKLLAFLTPALFAILGLTTALLIWVGGGSIIRNADMNVGDLVAFNQYLLVVLSPTVILAMVLTQIGSAEASAGRIAELLDTKPVVTDNTAPVSLDPNKVKGRVEFKNVSFGYDGEGNTIRNINLIAEPGEKVAFLGATGAGKTTLVNLIPRFYDAAEGCITLDGVDVRLIPQEELRKLVAIGLQEALLFSGTIRSNLVSGRPAATEDEMIIAAKAADADGFITAIPEGYDGHVARRGYNFSGGQRQRLSIARAITSQPKVIILDDSTSAVDVATESRIQAAMDEVLAGVTTFLVAQRISTVLLADKIVLLDGGEMVAVGSHKELLRTSPLYQEIFESQLGGIKTEDIR